MNRFLDMMKAISFLVLCGLASSWAQQPEAPAGGRKVVATIPDTDVLDEAGDPVKKRKPDDTVQKATQVPPSKLDAPPNAGNEGKGFEPPIENEGDEIAQALSSDRQPSATRKIVAEPGGGDDRPAARRKDEAPLARLSAFWQGSTQPAGSVRTPSGSASIPSVAFASAVPAEASAGAALRSPVSLNISQDDLAHIFDSPASAAASVLTRKNFATNLVALEDLLRQEPGSVVTKKPARSVDLRPTIGSELYGIPPISKDEPLWKRLLAVVNPIDAANAEPLLTGASAVPPKRTSDPAPLSDDAAMQLEAERLKAYCKDKPVTCGGNSADAFVEKPVVAAPATTDSPFLSWLKSAFSQPSKPLTDEEKREQAAGNFQASKDSVLDSIRWWKDKGPLKAPLNDQVITQFQAALANAATPQEVERIDHCFGKKFISGMDPGDDCGAVESASSSIPSPQAAAPAVVQQSQGQQRDRTGVTVILPDGQRFPPEPSTVDPKSFEARWAAFQQAPSAFAAPSGANETSQNAVFAAALRALGERQIAPPVSDDEAELRRRQVAVRDAEIAAANARSVQNSGIVPPALQPHPQVQPTWFDNTLTWGSGIVNSVGSSIGNVRDAAVERFRANAQRQYGSQGLGALLPGFAPELQPAYDGLMKRIREGSFDDIMNATSPWGGPLQQLQAQVTNRFDGYIHRKSAMWDLYGGLDGFLQGDAQSQYKRLIGQLPPGDEIDYPTLGIGTYAQIDWQKKRESEFEAALARLQSGLPSANDEPALRALDAKLAPIRQQAIDDWRATIERERQKAEAEGRPFNALATLNRLMGEEVSPMSRHPAPRWSSLDDGTLKIERPSLWSDEDWERYLRRQATIKAAIVGNEQPVFVAPESNTFALVYNGHDYGGARSALASADLAREAEAERQKAIVLSMDAALSAIFGHQAVQSAGDERQRTEEDLRAAVLRQTTLDAAVAPAQAAYEQARKALVSPADIAAQEAAVDAAQFRYKLLVDGTADEPVHFGFDDDALSADEKSRLNATGQKLQLVRQQILEQGGAAPVFESKGYTSCELTVDQCAALARGETNLPARILHVAAYNLDLSRRRDAQVVKYLSQNFGLQFGAPQGAGFANPKCMPTRDACNRRVEFTIAGVTEEASASAAEKLKEEQQRLDELRTRAATAQTQLAQAATVFSAAIRDAQAARAETARLRAKVEQQGGAIAAANADAVRLGAEVDRTQAAVTKASTWADDTQRAAAIQADLARGFVIIRPRWTSVQADPEQQLPKRYAKALTTDEGNGDVGGLKILTELFSGKDDKNRTLADRVGSNLAAMETEVGRAAKWMTSLTIGAGLFPQDMYVPNPVRSLVMTVMRGWQPDDHEREMKVGTSVPVDLLSKPPKETYVRVEIASGLPGATGEPGSAAPVVVPQIAVAAPVPATVAPPVQKRRIDEPSPDQLDAEAREAQLQAGTLATGAAQARIAAALAEQEAAQLTQQAGERRRVEAALNAPPGGVPSAAAVPGIPNGNGTIDQVAYFEKGHATLTEEGKRKLEQVRQQLPTLAVPTVDQGTPVAKKRLLIKGWASEEGALNDNIDLSWQRAEAAYNYMMSQGSTAGWEIYYQGAGVSTQHGDLAANRYVEFYILSGTGPVPPGVKGGSYNATPTQ